MSTEIYMYGRLLSGGVIQLPLASSAILFTVQYCEPDLFHINFVNGCPGNVEKWVTMDGAAVINIKHSFSTEAELPVLIRNCMLPAVYDGKNGLIRCGLCCTIRHVVKMTHQSSPTRSFYDLLGFRGGSLKACAEVSSWTKLCEVESPESISKLICQIRKLKIEVTDSIRLPLPQDLIRLERHLTKPTRPHNDDKRKRAFINEMKKGVTDLEASCVINNKTSVSFPLQRDVHCAHGMLRYQLCNFGTSAQTQLTLDPNCDCKQLSTVLDHPDQGAFLETSNAEASDQVLLEKKISRIQLSDKLYDSRDVAENISDLKEVVAYVNGLTLHDVDFVHLYFEGVSVTVADLILFTFIFHFLETLNFQLSVVKALLPNIVSWMNHMITLPRICHAAQKCQFNIEALSSPNSDGCVDMDRTANGNMAAFDITFDLLDSDADSVEDEALHRVSKNRHRVIKPEITEALQKIQTAGVKPKISPHPRGTDVHVAWDTVPAGAHPANELPKKRVARKCQQLENLVTAVEEVAKAGDVVVDFCSGGGHLGLLLAYRLPHCMVYLVENKEESLMRAKKRVDKLNLSNVIMYQCNLDYFHGNFDVGVSLHACGVATDLVLQQCINNNAAFVICPCCYGNIEDTHLLSYPRSQLLLAAGISSMDFLALGHAADQTELNIALEEQGRYCMNLVDSDRAALATESGYSVTLCSLQPLTCTTKNNLLIGSPSESSIADCK